MKLLTLNFIQCPAKACKLSRDAFPLQPEECTLVTSEVPFNPLLLRNLIGRLDWDALVGVCGMLGFTLPSTAPSQDELDAELSTPAEEEVISNPQPRSDQSRIDDEVDSTVDAMQVEAGDKDKDKSLTKELWSILLETRIEEGKLRCRSCGHEYRIKEGIGGFLLPPHMV